MDSCHAAAREVAEALIDPRVIAGFCEEEVTIKGGELTNVARNVQNACSDVPLQMHVLSFSLLWDTFAQPGMQLSSHATCADEVLLLQRTSARLRSMVDVERREAGAIELLSMLAPLGRPPASNCWGDHGLVERVQPRPADGDTASANAASESRPPPPKRPRLQLDGSATVSRSHGHGGSDDVEEQELFDQVHEHIRSVAVAEGARGNDAVPSVLDVLQQAELSASLTKRASAAATAAAGAAAAAPSQAPEQFADARLDHTSVLDAYDLEAEPVEGGGARSRAMLRAGLDAAPCSSLDETMERLRCSAAQQSQSVAAASAARSGAPMPLSQGVHSLSTVAGPSSSQLASQATVTNARPPGAPRGTIGVAPGPTAAAATQQSPASRQAPAALAAASPGSVGGVASHTSESAARGRADAGSVGLISALQRPLQNPCPEVWRAGVVASAKRKDDARRVFCPAILQWLQLKAEGWEVIGDVSGARGQAAIACRPVPLLPPQHGIASGQWTVCVVRRTRSSRRRCRNIPLHTWIDRSSDITVDGQREYAVVTLLRKQCPCLDAAVWQQPAQALDVLLAMLQVQLAQLSSHFDEFAKDALVGASAGLPERLRNMYSTDNLDDDGLLLQSLMSCENVVCESQLGHAKQRMRRSPNADVLYATAPRFLLRNGFTAWMAKWPGLFDVLLRRAHEVCTLFPCLRLVTHCVGSFSQRYRCCAANTATARTRACEQPLRFSGAGAVRPPAREHQARAFSARCSEESA